MHIIIKPEANMWRLKNVIKDLEIHRIDLLEKDALFSFFEKTKPQKIFHMAAYGVYPSQNDITHLFKNNVTATMNLISASCKSGYDNFVFAGSGFEYGYKDEPLKETDSLNPTDMYSFVKATLSSSIQMFSQIEKLPINIARLFLAYGKQEASTRLIPTLIKAYKNNESPQLQSPDNVRDFIYVYDVIDALIKISNSKYCGEIFNIGSGEEHTIKEIVDIVKNIFHSNIEPTWNVAGKRTFEPKHWRADITKAKKMLNWEPKTSIVNGLKMTITESF